MVNSTQFPANSTQSVTNLTQSLVNTTHANGTQTLAASNSIHRKDTGDGSGNPAFEGWWVAAIVAGLVGALLLLLLIVALFRRIRRRRRDANEAAGVTLNNNPAYLYTEDARQYSMPPPSPGRPPGGGGVPAASGLGASTRSVPQLAQPPAVASAPMAAPPPPGLDRPSMYAQFHNPIYVGGEGEEQQGVANWQGLMSAFYMVEQEGTLSATPSPPPPPEPPLTSPRASGAMAATATLSSTPMSPVRRFPSPGQLSMVDTRPRTPPTVGRERSTGPDTSPPLPPQPQAASLPARPRRLVVSQSQS